MVSASLKKKEKKPRAALGSYGLSCLSCWSWEAVSNKAAWNNRHVGMEGRFTLLHWLWVAMLRGLGIVSCKTECRLWETMWLYRRFKKKKRRGGPLAACLPPCRKKGSPCFSYTTWALAPCLTLQREGELDLRARSKVQLISCTLPLVASCCIQSCYRLIIL